MGNQNLDHVRPHDRTAPLKMLVTGNFPTDGPSISFGIVGYPASLM